MYYKEFTQNDFMSIYLYKMTKNFVMKPKIPIDVSYSYTYYGINIYTYTFDGY